MILKCDHSLTFWTKNLLLLEINVLITFFNHVDRILYPGIPDISPELTWFHKPFLVTYLWGFYMWTSISVKKKEWINGWSFLQKLSLIQMYLQRLIEKPVKHLRWRLLIRYIPESLAKILFPLMKCWKILEVK